MDDKWDQWHFSYHLPLAFEGNMIRSVVWSYLVSFKTCVPKERSKCLDFVDKWMNVINVYYWVGHSEGCSLRVEMKIGE